MWVSFIESIERDVVYSLNSKFGIEKEKAGKALRLANETINEALKNEAALGNFAGVKTIINNEGSPETTAVFNKLVFYYSAYLTYNLNLSITEAKGIASFVMKYIFKKLADKNEDEKLESKSILDILNKDR